MARTTASGILPSFYCWLFLVIEPGIIWTSLVAIVVSPSNHFYSLAPSPSHGYLFQPTSNDVCDQVQAWNTSQLRHLLYLSMAGLAFSAFIEPALLYVARYKMVSTRDAELVITAVLISFGAFDVFHLGATYVVTGSRAILPTLALEISDLDFYSCINFWVPVVWLVLRGLWVAGVGRESARDKED